jgi:hypothetical protein
MDTIRGQEGPIRTISFTLLKMGTLFSFAQAELSNTVVAEWREEGCRR